jgi:O-antigen/teichoic acid export membrane protein
MSIKIHDLKHRTTRGAFASIAGQSTNVALRLGSMMILARMLTPRDFGLIGMSGTCIELLALLQDAGLVAAAVQSPTLSHEQSSTLFWLNLGLGTLLTLICAGLAPILALFYHEPQVTWITVLAATTFIFNGAAAQHRALLSRAIRPPGVIQETGAEQQWREARESDGSWCG